MFTTRRLAAGGLVLAAVTGLGLTFAYVERGPIGVWLATDYLRRQGVPATIRIDRLDTGGFSGAVSLGRADDPDLVVDRLDVTFDPLPLWRGGLAAPRIHAIRLVRPRMRARFDGRRLTFGTLQRLIEEAQRGPSGGPGPSVAIHDGRLNLDTPAGPITLRGDGVLDQGRIGWASARLAPGDLKTSNARLDGLTGELHLKANGADRLHARWRLAATDVETGTRRAGAVEVSGEADAPYAQSGFNRLDGPIRIETTARARSVTAKGAGAKDLQAHMQLGGVVHGPLEALSFSGPASARVQAASAAFGDGTVNRLMIGMDSPRLVLESAAPNHALRLMAPLRLAITSQSGRTTAVHTSIALGPSAADATGQVGISAQHWKLTLDGAAQARAALGPVQARQVAHALVPVAAGADLEEAVARNLRSAHVAAPAYRIAASDQRVGFDLTQPLKAVFADGAAIEMSRQPGLSAVELSGGVLRGGGALHLAGPGLPTVSARIDRYRFVEGEGEGEGEAEVSLDVSGAAGPAHGASLALTASIEDRAGRLQLFARDCAKLSVGALENGADIVMHDASLSLCPPPAAPFLVLNGSRWSAAGRVEHVGARLPTAEVELSDIDGDFSLRGDGAIGPVGHVTIAHARLIDLGRQARFNPLIATGGADLTSTSWRGELDLGLPSTVASAAAVSLGRLSLVHDPRTRRGEALFVSTLHFKPKGFQPANVAPDAREWLSDVQGDIEISVEASWADGRVADRAEVRTTALDLKSPAGPVGGLRGDLRFASLAPLRTEPNQQVTVDRLDTLLPLTALSASFELDPTHLVLQQAGATIAGGRIGLAPMSVALLSPGRPPTAQGELFLKDVDLGEMVKVLNLASAVSIQARIDGVLPFAFGPAGLRLSRGQVSADGPGRLTIRRQALSGAASPGSEAPNNAVQDFAYQALENLAFDSLQADVASRPQGRLGVVLHVKGRHDPPTAPVTRIGLIDLLRGHAFDKPIPLPKGTPVDLTLDTSLNFDELLAAYGGLRTVSGSAGVQSGAPK